MKRTFRLAMLLFPALAMLSLPAYGAPTGTPSAEEQRLYDLIMEYRAEEALPPIPHSPSLTYVAQAHVRDLDAHFIQQGGCNAHSWSGNGEWTSCCYTPDHAEAECMWLKPRELTEYDGYGYEIAYTYSAGAGAEDALRSWQGSPPHNAVILNADTWRNITWKAIGVGIHGDYAVVWFGEEPDPDGP